MKRVLYIILLLLATGGINAQTYPRKCTEAEIPTSARNDYYKTVELYLNIYYQMLPISIGSAENREAIIDKVMASKHGTTLKTEFLLNPVKNLSFVSPSQYYVKFENEFGQMADEVEFVVDNCKHGDIMMNSLTSCYIPVDYDLTAMKGNEVLFKRRCRMTFLFQKVAISSFAQTMQVEPLKDIIAYRPRLKFSSFKQQYDQAVQWYTEGVGQKTKYLSVFKSLAEKDFTDAQWHYGLCLLEEDSTHYADAVIWLQKAVDKNHPNAHNTLGWCYREGAGVSKNLQKAFNLFKQSAELGWKNGMHNLADAYNNAKGCPKDVDKAIYWYEKAADLGWTEDYFTIALLYFNKHENVKGKEYLLKGYEKKEINCMRYLGLCYKLKLNSFPVDYDQAYFYLKPVVEWCEENSWIKMNKEWTEYTIGQFNEVKDWYKRKPEVLLDSLRQDSNNPYINKAKVYKYKKKNKEKFDKIVAIWNSNPTKAMAEMDKLADVGMPEALEFIGDQLFKKGQTSLAFHSYAAAAAYAPSDKAFNGLANCYFYGGYTQRDYMQAIRLYQKAYSLNPDEPEPEFGFCYYKGLGIERNYKKAIELFNKIAHKNSEAALCIGECYDRGLGVSKDSIEAAKWFKTAAHNGSGNGMYYWGLYLYDGIAVEKDTLAAIEWLKKAIEKDNVQAMLKMGSHFYGLKQYEQSLKYYQMAAENGNKVGQYWTGWLYAEEGTSFKSKAKSKVWFEKSAEQGYSDAQFYLGVLLYEEKTAESQKKAFEWWTKSGKQGNRASQYNLAICYENGVGVKRSMANAVEWYIKAARNKWQMAIKRISHFKKIYKPSRIPSATKAGQFTGMVVNGGKPLEGVFVYVADTDNITMTDAKGRFFLSGVSNWTKVKILHPDIGEIPHASIKFKDYKGKEYTNLGQVRGQDIEFTVIK